MAMTKERLAACRASLRDDNAWAWELFREVERTQAFDELKAALEVLACWSEGPEVTSRFDDPHSAKIARAALSKCPRE